MQVDLPITLYEENISAIMFADHPGDHRTTENHGVIKLVYVPMAEQLADGMTKDLPSSLFESICLVLSPPI
jgi:hypothetical protein